MSYPTIDFLFLSEEDMIKAGVRDMRACINTMEEVIKCLRCGDYVMAGSNHNSHGSQLSFPKSSKFPNMPLDEGDDRRFMAMPAYLGGSFDLAGMKWYGSKPDDYEARSNLMWASTIALNHLLTAGKGGAWSVHPIEHVVSAYYDITHAVGLAILTPVWMRYVLDDTNKARFARFAREVWEVRESDDMVAAEKGIECVISFNKSLGMPSSFSEIGITSELFDKMAEEAVHTSGLAERSYVKLTPEDVSQILYNAY